MLAPLSELQFEVFRVTETPATVGLFVTCLVDLFRPRVGFAAVKLLEQAGCEVVVPRAQTCCGQPAYNAGDRANAKAIAAQVIAVFEEFDWVIAPSGSCAAMVRVHYPQLFAADLAMAAKARELAARTHELVAFLVDVLGVGKWAAGPSALGVYLGKTWKYGALLQHYVSFAGSDKNADVNMTNLQYLYYYSLNATTSIGAAPNIIINWEESGTNRFTIPVGLGINKTVQFGKLPVRLGVEVYYSVWRPNNVASTEWNLRFYAIPAVPSALFGWM